MGSSKNLTNYENLEKTSQLFSITISRQKFQNKIVTAVDWIHAKKFQPGLNNITKSKRTVHEKLKFYEGLTYIEIPSLPQTQNCKLDSVNL